MPRNVHTNSAPTPDKAKAEQSNAHILDLIGQVSKGYGHAQDKAQECGVAIMVHAMTYSDCSKAKALCRAVPARERRSLMGWFALYSPIEVTMARKEEDDKVRLRKATDEGYHPFSEENLAKAKTSLWWTDPAGVNPAPPMEFAQFEQSIEKRLKSAKDSADTRFIESDRQRVVEFTTAVIDFIAEYNKRQETPKATMAEGGAGEDSQKPETAKTA